MNRIFTFAKYHSTVALLILLTACGGGGSESDAPAANLISHTSNQASQEQPTPNAPPTILLSSVEIEEDTELNSDDLISLFDDPESDDLNVTILSVSDGEIRSQPEGFTFVPDTNFSGSAELTLTVSDGTNTIDAEIVVTVTPVNDQPTAQEDIATLGGESQSLLINALANDSDVEDETLSIVSAVAVAGTVSIEDGQIRYQREPGYEGEDVIEYTIADTEGLTAQGQIAIQVDRATLRTVFLNWSAPTERENGEAMSTDEISGYEIHYRLAQESLDETVVIEGGEESNTRISLVLEGEYEFRIATIDTDGLYSDFSEPVNLAVYF